jgi:hypothetical protein
MATILTLPIDDNRGYTAEDVAEETRTQVTLQELLEGIQDAIREHGADAIVVLDNGQRYGAQFGIIRDASMGHEWFQKADAEDEPRYDY